MAETLVGAGYDSMIGTRQSTIDPNVTEYYNKSTGTGFSSPDDLLRVVQPLAGNQMVDTSNVFDVLKRGLTPSSAALNPTANGAEAATALDGTKSSQLASSINGLPTLEQLMQESRSYRDQILGLSTPSQDELAARQGLNQATNTLKNFDISLEGGIQNIMNKPIAMEFQQGQQSALTRDAAFTRSSLTRSIDVANQTLTTLQNARLQLLDKLNTARGFGQEDIGLHLKLDEITRTEQAQAKELALQYGVTKPFYNIGGTVYRSSDGKAYSTPEQFFADGGAQDFTNVQTIDPNAMKQQQQNEALVLGLIDTYPDAGILPTDSYEQAAAKISSSRIYQDKVRPPANNNPSPKEEEITEAESGSLAKEYLNGYKGEDGKVSPDVWQAALNAWLDDGHSTADFIARFSSYVNKSYEGWKNNYAGF